MVFHHLNRLESLNSSSFISNLNGYFVLLHVTSCYFMLFHVISCYFMLFHVISCYFMLFHVISCYFMLFHVISCYFMLFHHFNHLESISFYIILYHSISIYIDLMNESQPFQSGYSLSSHRCRPQARLKAQLETEKHGTLSPF